MKLLSLDLSTTSTGFAIFVDGKLESSGTIAPKNKDWKERVFLIYKDLRKKINIESIYNRDIKIVVEKPLSLQNGDTTIKLAKLHGLILSLSFDMDVSLEEIDNQTWKKHIAGAKATKEQTQDFLRRVRGIKTETTDESDAVGVGLGFMAEQNIPDILKTSSKRPLGTKRNKKVRKV